MVNNDTHIADRIVPYIFKDKFSKEFSFSYFYAELCIRDGKILCSWKIPGIVQQHVKFSAGYRRFGVLTV